MNKISFIVFTFNEEHRVSYAIRNLMPYGEVYILDGGSTDRTKEFAESLGAKFFVRPKTDKAYVETPEVFNFVKNLVKTDWVYWGYVDNLLPKTLLEKLVAISCQDKIKYVLAPIYTYLWGETRRPMHKGYLGCFFRPQSMDFVGNAIHGMGKFLGSKQEMLYLPMRDEFAVRHFSLYNTQKFTNAHLHYADAEAQQRYQDGKRFSSWRMLVSMARYFFLYYRYAYKSGAKGLFASLQYASFRLLMFSRLYELEYQISLDSIERSYAVEKAKIIGSN